MTNKIHKIDFDRLKTVPDEPLGSLTNTNHIEHDFNVYWCDDHPELFGKAIQRALLSCPPDKWTITIKPAYMPGMTWQLKAVRKEPA